VRKLFVVDTSVLLYDKCSIHSFPENDVVIPLVALDELDRFKEKKGVTGESARYVNRYLDSLRKNGNLHLGVELENGQTIRVALDGYDNVPQGLNDEDADNKMISLALCLQKQDKQPITLITKDINFRVKCDALGINSEDYYKDKVIQSDNESYKGFTELIVGQEYDHLIDSFFNEEDVVEDFEDLLGRKLYPNEYLIVKSGQSKSMIACLKKGKLTKVKEKGHLEDFMGIKPRNREQLFALDLLANDNVPLVSLTGIAGSGKTFLTLMAGLDGINRGKYKRIVITRNIQPVGRDIGFLPGDANDKMLPWIAPIIDNFRQGMKDKDLTYFECMRQTGQIEIAPLAFMRGRTFSDTFLIIDESQNSTIHELKTVITRIGENSKIVLLGDTDQIDTPYIDSLSNGLTIVGEKFKSQELSGHIQLQKGERSALSFLASKIL
jgi:PhoH-like ATPase